MPLLLSKHSEYRSTVPAPVKMVWVRPLILQFNASGAGDDAL
jgi:hypothetical protein